MNAVKPNAVLLKHEDYTPYQFIEKVGRICYKSEDLIAEGTDEKFVKMLLGNNHLAMLEHEFCYFVVHNEAFKDHNIWTTKLYDMVTKEKYLNWAYIADEKQKDALFISGSFRAFIECYSKLVKYMAHPLKDTYPLLFANLQMKIEGKAHNKYNVCKMLTREEFIKEAEAYPNHPEIFQKCLPHTMLFTEDRGCCYDDQTMVLTKSGWKYFKDVSLNDEFLTLDDDNNILYSKANKVIVKDYDGPMHKWKSTQINLKVTPNHNMWVYDYDKRSDNTRIWKFLKSEECTNGRYVISKSSKGTQSEGYLTFQIPSVTRKHGTGERIYDGGVYNANLFFELIGWFITDGSLSYGKNGSGNRICIAQIKPKGRARIRELLNLLDIGYNETDTEFRIKKPALFDWVLDNFYDKNNLRKSSYISLPRWMFDKLSQENLRALLKGILGGNGSKHTGGTGYQLYTYSEPLTKDMVELALLIGITANIYEVKPRKRNFNFDPNKPAYWVNCDRQFVVSFCPKHQETMMIRKGGKEFKKEVDYCGKVYCVELPQYHRLYVMRNGKPCWCGNSHEQVRHRPVSYAQESTRYVNYSRGKYGSEITVISPSFFEGEDKKELYQEWEAAMNDAEKHYLKLIEMGAVAQEARTVLPQSTKADIVVTATEEEWRHILNLRLFGTTGKPHPQMKEVMEIAYPQLMKEIRGYDEESIKYKK